MALLGAKDVLAVDDIAYETVSVPEWGGDLRLRSLSGKERDALEESMVERGKDGQPKVSMRDYRARLVAASAVDEAGQKLFYEKDIKALSAKSARALDRVATVASRLSGLEEESVEESREDFDSAQSEASTSA